MILCSLFGTALIVAMSPLLWICDSCGLLRKGKNKTVCGRKRVKEDSMFAVKGEIGFRVFSLVYFSN